MPGETDEKFMETYNFLQELEVSYFHVFTYSERDNTTAVDLQGVVSREKRAERSKMLQILSTKKKRQFYESHQNNSYPVLWEGEHDDNGYVFGFTSNYIKVKTKDTSAKANTIQQIKLINLDRDGIFKHE